MPPALIVLADEVGAGVRELTEDASVANALLGRTLDLARKVGGVGRVLLFAPPEAEPALTARSLGFRLWPAEGDTAGARYSAAFRQAGELGYEGAMVIGLRVANFAAERLAEAAAMLAEHQGVVAGDGNGGVALLGLARYEPTLLPPDADVPSLDLVQTRARQQLVRLATLEDHAALTPATLSSWLDGAHD